MKKKNYVKRSHKLITSLILAGMIMTNMQTQYVYAQDAPQLGTPCTESEALKEIEEMKVMAGESGVNAMIAASNVAYRTQEEIANYIAMHPYDLNMGNSFQTEPSYRSPYVLGRLTDATMNNAMQYTNVLRYIAGLSEEVSLNESYIEYAQASSVVNAANGVLTHYPSQPSGMSDEMYQKGAKGSSSSNIASGYGSIITAITNGYMNDSDAGNIPMMGHRRWILDPRVSEIGFGAAGRYSAMFVIGNLNRSALEYGVMWPARNMPVEMFGNSWVWTISFGKAVSTSASVKLTNNNSGQSWYFSTSSSDGDYYINNGGYGQPGCVIFRPKGVTYKAGDTYTVEVKNIGISGMVNEYSYKVNFFSIAKPVKNGIYSENGGLYYYENDRINTSYTGFVNSNNIWYCVKNGKVESNYTGLWNDANVGWWYVENGTINFNYNGFVQYNDYWWCVAGGRVAFEYTGLWSDQQVGWWFVQNGAIDFGYNGFVPNENGWWCVAGGEVKFGYTGLWNDPNVGWWFVQNGAINFDYNGFVQNEYGWWCVAGGEVKFDYTGLWYDETVGWWYVENGMINFAGTGTVEYNGNYYNVVNGQVIF